MAKLLQVVDAVVAVQRERPYASVSKMRLLEHQGLLRVTVRQDGTRWHDLTLVRGALSNGDEQSALSGA